MQSEEPQLKFASHASGAAAQHANLVTSSNITKGSRVITKCVLQWAVVTKETEEDGTAESSSNVAGTKGEYLTRSSLIAE